MVTSRLWESSVNFYYVSSIYTMRRIYIFSSVKQMAIMQYSTQSTEHIRNHICTQFKLKAKLVTKSLDSTPLTVLAEVILLLLFADCRSLGHGVGDCNPASLKRCNFFVQRSSLVVNLLLFVCVHLLQIFKFRLELFEEKNVSKKRQRSCVQRWCKLS